MKIELEISEEAVNAALKEQIDTAIRIATGAYQLTDRVRRVVNAAIGSQLDDLIWAQIADTPAIEEAVRKAIERSLKSRLNKLLVEGEK
jgi:ABC-type sugar transport system substrate-binding protein